MSTVTKLHVGVIGMGYTGRLHAQAYARCRRTALVAVADPSGRAAAVVPGLEGVEWFSAHEDLLAQDLDAVSVCVPTALHVTVAVAALAAGKHVLLEKPLCVTTAEADAIVRAARAAGKVLLVGMTHRFYPEVRGAYRAVRSGAIGDILACEDSIIEHTQFLTLPDWYFDKARAGGGIALTSGVHLVDRLQWFVGEPIVAVSGTMSNRSFHRNVEDCGQMHLRFRSGVSAVVTMAFVPEPQPLVCDLRVLGTRGRVIVHTWSGYQVCRDGSSTEYPSYPAGYDHASKVLDAIALEVEAFCEYVLLGKTPEPTPEECAHAIAVLQAFYDACRSGGTVALRA